MATMQALQHGQGENGVISRVVQVRLAALMLRDTPFSVPEVMDLVGFDDKPRFGSMFQACIGCSPTEYRCRGVL